MPDKYEALRAALAAGPTPGSWAVEIMSSGRTTVTAGQFFVAGADTSAGISDENAAYIAAAYPETIRGLLAERDALLKAQAEKDAEIHSLRHELNSVQFKLRGMDMRPQEPIARVALSQQEQS